MKVVSFALIAAVSLALPVSHANSIRTVALSGDPAPGTPDGVVYHSFGPPTLNDNGHTAFVSLVSGSGVIHSTEGGIWSEGSGLLRKVVRGGDFAPGTPSGVIFRGFRVPSLWDRPSLVLNQRGQTAFRASIDGPGLENDSDEGIWSEKNGTLQKLAQAGEPAPGTPNGVRFGDCISCNLLLNSKGQTAFRGSLTGSGVTNLNDIGIWSDRSGTLQKVAREGDSAPGMVNGVVFRTIYEPVLNDNGQTAFSADLAGPGINYPSVSIWSEGAGSLQMIVQAGEPAHGTPSGVTYRRVSYPVINNVGRIAFLGEVTGPGFPVTRDSGIWSDVSGALENVALTTQPAPDTPPGVTYGSISTPTLNDRGQILFRGALDGPGFTDANSGGIWKYVNGESRKIALTGEPAPGTPAGVTFQVMSRTSLNDLGQAAFEAFVTGPGINWTNDLGIWAEDHTGEVTLIAREGDQLDVDDGPAVDLRTIKELRFLGGFDGRIGLPGGFNTLGQLAFMARFTNRTEGVFVSNVTASLPLPGDFDSDDVVDGADFIAWQRGAVATWNPDALAIWEANFGTSFQQNLRTVPEPAEFVHLAVASVALLSVPSIRLRGDRCPNSDCLSDRFRLH